MKKKSLKKIEKERYRKEIIKNERYRTIKVIDKFVEKYPELILMMKILKSRIKGSSKKIPNGK